MTISSTPYYNKQIALYQAVRDFQGRHQRFVRRHFYTVQPCILIVTEHQPVFKGLMFLLLPSIFSSMHTLTSTKDLSIYAGREREGRGEGVCKGGVEGLAYYIIIYSEAVFKLIDHHKTLYST